MKSQNLIMDSVARLKEIVSFKKNNPSAEVILVSDNTFTPIADIGDYIGLILVDVASIEKHTEKLILVTLVNDLIEFGILKKDRHFFSIVNSLTDSHIKLSKSNINKISQIVWLRKIY